MINLEKFGVRELSIQEKLTIDGGFDYFSWMSYPTDGNGNIIINPASILYVAGGNAFIGVGNAGIAIANGVSAAWNWLTS